MSARRALAAAAGVAALVVAVGSAYQLLVAVEVLELGDLPGEGSPGDDLFFLLPLYALLLGGLALLPLAALRGPAAELASATAFRLLPLLAAAFPLCRAAAFDTYYAPAQIRFWTNASPWGLAAVALLGVAWAVLAWRRPGPVAVAGTGVTMVAAALLAIGMGLH